MEVPATDELLWIIQPLVDAGLAREQIESLAFRLAFEAIVGGTGVCWVADLVSDQPAQVQAAWSRAVGRMITAQGSRRGSRDAGV